MLHAVFGFERFSRTARTELLQKFRTKDRIFPLPSPPPIDVSIDQKRAAVSYDVDARAAKAFLGQVSVERANTICQPFIINTFYYTLTNLK